MPAPSDSLSHNLNASLAEEEACVERPDHGGNIECTYKFNIVLDYTTAALPRNIACFIENQADAFYSLEPGQVDLSTQDGSVTVVASALAIFSPDGNPMFTNPVYLECILAEPSGSGNLRKDGVDVAFNLPSFTQIDSCVPATHPDCTV